MAKATYLIDDVEISIEEPIKGILRGSFKVDGDEYMKTVHGSDERSLRALLSSCRSIILTEKDIDLNEAALQIKEAKGKKSRANADKIYRDLLKRFEPVNQCQDA